MARFFSLESSVLDLNGHVFTGFSDDADAISFPTIELVTVKRGADGRMTASSTGNKGGTLIIKLQPTSDSTKFMMNNIASLENNARVNFNGTFVNNETGVKVNLQNGVIADSPLGQTVGKGDAANLEFSIEFERITPDYSSANFEA